CARSLGDYLDYW
nr:immunoglobulin heavy chain junction region [Mus musculus]